MGVLAAKSLNTIVYGKSSQTRAMSARRTQVDGVRKGVLLTDNAEEKEIVESHMKV